MSSDPVYIETQQSDLFSIETGGTNIGTPLPLVWNATEALTSPDLEQRKKGLDLLVETNIVKVSPLVAYILATRFIEPDIELRGRIINILDQAIETDNQGQDMIEQARLHLVTKLSQMRIREIFALLQVADFDPESEQAVARLLNYCPYAGRHLADVLADRKTPLAIRKQAIRLIEKVGYLEAIPVLERAVARLKRSNGHHTYDENEEHSLIPLINSALDILRAP